MLGMCQSRIICHDCKDQVEWIGLFPHNHHGFCAWKIEYRSQLLPLRMKLFGNQVWLGACSWLRQFLSRLREQGKWSHLVKRRRKPKKKNKRNKKPKRVQEKMRIVRMTKALKWLWLPALRGLLSVWMTLAYNCNIVCKLWKQRWMQGLRHFWLIKRLWMSNWPIIDKSQSHSPPFPHHLHPKAMYETLKTMSKLSLEGAHMKKTEDEDELSPLSR